MINTRDFKTKTEFVERANGSLPGLWEVAIDIGYSSVKVFSPNMVGMFPSYARLEKKDLEIVAALPDDAILYRDDVTNEVWVVGELAQNLIKTSDTSDSEEALFGRERYNNPMFLVLARVGLASGMRANQYGSYKPNKHLVVQTGLPEKYLKADKPLLMDVLVGSHRFSVKFGSGQWESFDFTLDDGDVFITSQPKGTFFSVAIQKNGRWIPDVERYLNSNVIIFDPGFGTLDFFPIRSRVVGAGETFPNLGMRRVFQETVDTIFDKYHTEIPVHALQNYLSSGNIKIFDRKTISSKQQPFGDILEDSNRKVCMEAIHRMLDVIEIQDYDYLVVTGGTGSAWNEIIRESLSGLDTLTILDGNMSDPSLSCVYSNVRGYFLFRFNKLRAAAAKATK